MITIKAAYGDDLICSQSDINAIKPAHSVSFPEIKSLVFYRESQKWVYSTESIDEIHQKFNDEIDRKIKGYGHATAVN